MLQPATRSSPPTALPPARLPATRPTGRNRDLPRAVAPLACAVLLASLVLPPVLAVVWLSLSADGRLSLEAYGRLFSAVGLTGRLLGDTVSFALGSAVLALGLGSLLAWLAERTNAPFRRLAYLAAFASLAIPAVVKTVAWILLLGPRAGLLSSALGSLFPASWVGFSIFSLAGMVLVEGLLWAPVVFLLLAPPFRALDAQLEEAARINGASPWHAFRTITLPLAAPAWLAVLLLTSIRALEAFEVPTLLGIPGGVSVFTSELFILLRRSGVPRYAEAGAYSTLLLVLTALGLLLYHRLTGAANRFAQVGTAGYRPRLQNLGRGRWLGGLLLLILPALLLLPLLALIWVSFQPYVRPLAAGLDGGLTLSHYQSVLGLPGLSRAVLNSGLLGPLAASLVVGLTLVSSWLVVFGRARFGWLLDLLATLPLALPGLVLGLALLRLALATPLPLYGTSTLLLIAYWIRFLPIGSRYSHAGLLSLHPSLAECSRVHGATWLQTVRRIVVPLLLPALAAAWAYVVLLSIREVGTAVLLAGSGNEVVGVILWDLWLNGQVGEMAAFSLLLAAVLIPLSLAVERAGRDLRAAE
jgi:iron(III) transport system permease protein